MEKGSIKALARKVFAATRRSISPYDICLAYCKDHGWHVVLMGDGGHGDKAVSYTHLDVYKRQVYSSVEPELLFVQVTASGEVSTVPSFPTATKSPFP